jgi:hypothetical protein
LIRRWNNSASFGVYIHMTFRLRWGRKLRNVGISLLVLVAGTAAYVPIQQRILRLRAERLLADISEVQMGKSTWADAQRLMYRWGAWGAFKGSCTAERCDYRIEMDDGFTVFLIRHALPDGPYRWLGGRGAAIVGGLVVRNGLIWGKSFQLDVLIPDGGYFLMADAASVSRFSNEPVGWIIRHPEYYVGIPGACESCKSIYARFTPFAVPGIVRALMTDINLDCLTRYIPCTNESDIMPATWKQVIAERKQGYDADAGRSCRFPMEILGRDPRYVAIVEVVSNRFPKEWGGQSEATTFRLVEQLKGSRFHEPGKTVEVELGDNMVNGSGTHREKMLRPGKRFILAVDSQIVRGPGQAPSPEVSECGIIPFSEENLAAVERGIQRDVLRTDPDPDTQQ